MNARRIDGQAVNGGRQKLCDILPLKMPLSVQIFPIYACNLKCKYCLHSMPIEKRPISLPPPRRQMSLNTFMAFVDGFLPYGEKNSVKVMHFSGYGEPLLHPYLTDMIKYAVKSAMFSMVDIVTNGLLLDKEKITALRESGLNKIRISLQGLDAVAYKKISGVEIDFNEFYRKLKKLYQEKGDMKIYIKIMDKALFNHSEEEFIEKFSIVADNVAVEHLIPIVHEIDYKNNFSVDNFDVTVNANSVLEADICPAPFYQILLYPNGDIIPCCNAERPAVVGNVSIEKTYNIFHGDKLNKFRRMMLMKKKNKVCMECNLYKYQLFAEDYLDDCAEYLLKFYR